MKFKFDLISDLHNDTWSQNDKINWEGLGTSLVAVVLGDVSNNIDDTYETVVDISKYYKYVVYVDGNNEHNGQLNIQERTYLLKNKLSKYHNISVLNRGAIIIDGVAFVGANGWWTFNFCEPDISREECYLYFLQHGYYGQEFISEVLKTAKDDATILCEIVSKLNTDPAVKEIVMVTHTSPFKNFNYIPEGYHPANYGRCGSSFLSTVFGFDPKEKIKTWCFGHLHTEIDQTIHGIRYICHPRGRSEDSPSNKFYYPKLVVLN